ncbi:hypothetical protein [Pseudonocardia spinosispora]|uniref:hypothetical protein n=1 Tax=Pseudonocardia spinosispora TaxID=103441 RepID=UPI0004267610|nr:hypothetical protein [Pseudonocardia spinosispora]
MEWDAIVDELYALPREEFTPARAEWAKRAKATGDKQLASAITALRRPTVAAWLTNQLVRDRTTEVDALADLGSRLRTAHEQLDGAALRELSTRRRELLTEWLNALHGVGAAHDSPVSDATGRELEAMFTAALAEPAAWHALAGGHLSSAKDVETARDESNWPTSAPGARPRPALVPSKPAERRPEPADAPADEKENAALTRARAELTRTEDALAEAERLHADARDAYDEAAAEETDARQAVAHRRAELVAAEQAEQSARQRARFVRRQREDRDRELRDARRRATLARDRLAALEQ